MKKVLCIFLALLMTVLLASCDNNSAPSQESSAAEAAEARAPEPEESQMEEEVPADPYEHTEFRGVDAFLYARTYVPTATGYPLLTDEEIDALIETEDYQLIADTISTLADCVNYFIRADFQQNKSDYFSGWSTHICGQQVMARRGGKCGGMCNALAYILKDDYDELGYIIIDGHVMNYLKTDGLYYVINSVGYAKANGYLDGWFRNSFDKAPVCADNMQTIADGWVIAGWTTHNFFTYVSPGDMFPLWTEPDDPDRRAFPTGTEVTDWLGKEVCYLDVEAVRKLGPPGVKFNRMIDWTTGTDWVDEADIF